MKKLILVWLTTFLVSCASTPETLRRIAASNLDLPYCVIPLQKLAPDAVQNLAREQARQWNQKLGKPLVETDLSPHITPDILDSKPKVYRVQGFPAQVKWVDKPEAMIFRHYRNRPETLEQIKKEESIANSFVPYEVVAPGISRKIYEDITGVFLTVPTASSSSVGRAESHYFVDLKVLPGTPVLELEKNNIYVVPLPPQTQPWIAKIYQDFLDGKPMTPQHQELCEDLKRRGGISPKLNLPVTIVK